MPLVLGGLSTERAQLIAFDPSAPVEVRESRVRYKQLRRRGFRLADRREGQIVLKPPPRDANIGVLRILSQNGDDRVVWNRRDPGQVREAYQKFRDFLARGYIAYATLSDGRKGYRIDDFDPGLEEILLVPSTMPG